MYLDSLTIIQSQTMKTFLFTLALIFCLNPFFAQNSPDENEVRKINEAYDDAIKNADVSFYERVLANDYVSYGPDGSIKTRDQVLEEVKKQKEKPTYRMSAIDSEDVKVKISENLAVVTAKWKATTHSLENDEPHDDEGNYMAVYEKRNGTWQLISEMGSEKPHSPEEMEASVRKASDSYDEAIRTGDKESFSKLLADDYQTTDPMGNVKSKKESAEYMFDPKFKMENSSVNDKKFRIYGNMAVETGEYDVTGSYEGKKFSETGRYTSTWRFKDGKWQMVADHTSVTKRNE